MILKNCKAIFGLILSVCQGIIPSHAAEHPSSTYPTVISLCSGLGVTDRVFLQSGFQIIASADMDSDRTTLNKENNLDCIQDPSLRYQIFTEDIRKDNVQREVHKSAQQKIGPNKDVDLVYCFVAQGKQIDSIAIIHLG